MAMDLKEIEKLIKEALPEAKIEIHHQKSDILNVAYFTSYSCCILPYLHLFIILG